MLSTGQGSGRVARRVAAALMFMWLFMGSADGAGAGTDWEYEKGGAGNWYKKYPDCGGVVQSPVNIITSQVLTDKNLQPLDFSDYSVTSQVKMKLENLGGFTAEVIMSGKVLYLKGGSLPDIYQLVQFHFHWGINESHGSEHSIDGTFYPLEVHFVHKQRRFHNATVAALKPHGLTVVAFLFTPGKTNAHLDPVIQQLKGIKNPNDEKEIPAFSIKSLLPSGDIPYYRYFGSLTTPPCSESVIWSVAVPKIEISLDQLAKFRSLYTSHHKALVNNYRPIQAMNVRTITKYG